MTKPKSRANLGGTHIKETSRLEAEEDLERRMKLISTQSSPVPEILEPLIPDVTKNPGLMDEAMEEVLQSMMPQLKTAQSDEISVREAYEAAQNVAIESGEEFFGDWSDIGKTLRYLWRNQRYQVLQDLHDGAGVVRTTYSDPILDAFVGVIVEEFKRKQRED